MVLFTGVQIVYVWFSVAILAWALPSTSGPQQGVSERQRMAEKSFVNTPDQDSWFKHQIIYVPRRNDWPVVVDPSYSPGLVQMNGNDSGYLGFPSKIFRF